MEVVKSPSPLAIYGDHELLELIAMKDDPGTSEQAFNEFYGRFHAILYQSVYFLCASLPSQDEMAKIVFNNTFYNAYKYPGSFKIEAESDPGIIKKRIIGWLLAIAKTDLKGQFAKIKEDRETKEKIEEAFQVMKSNAAGPRRKETYREELVRKAIEQIPKERDREIFYTYWLFYHPTAKGLARKLPDDVLEGLASKFNTTDVNIRQIVSRSKKIVKQYLEAHLKK